MGNHKQRFKSYGNFRKLLLSASCISVWLFVCIPISSLAQFTYQIDQSIPVIGPKGLKLSNAWAGGLNATQFNMIDLNGDNKEDLVLFDRMVNQITTFLNVNGKWKYAPEFEVLFPPEITNWVLLKDFNCDGKKDIFCGDLYGVKVFQNVTKAGGGLEWKRFMFYGQSGIATDILLTKGFAQKTNLQLQYDDLPTIVDADNDGDLDIFNVRFTGNGSVEYHQNFSRERYGVCDSLDFERQTNIWGGFTQCKCARFAYNFDECSFSGGRVQHGGGKALLALDIDQDGDQDLLFSEAECSGLYAVVNNGTISSPIITSNFLYPPSKPVDINIFPVAFLEDVDMDGLKDLIATPNVYRKDFVNQDLKSSTWFYKNFGSATLPDFRFVKKDFLQEQMIDVGDNAVPAFFDIDNDGDLDLFISDNSDSTSFGSITLYTNTGNSVEPEFTFQTSDFINFKALALNNIRIQLADLTADGRPDLCFMGSDSRGVTNLYYLPHRQSGNPFDTGDLKQINFFITYQDNFHFTDVDHDGRMDLILVTATGGLEYWRNTGPSGFPSFNIENPVFLGFGQSTSNRIASVYTADLNSDGGLELVMSDQYGNVSVIKNYHDSQELEVVSDLMLNTINNRYGPTSLGRGFMTVAHLFNTRRPAIIMGNVKGGLNILRNEEKDLVFRDLKLEIWPNPVLPSESFYVDSNLLLTLDIFTSLGQLVQGGISIHFGTNELSAATFSSGLYILRFSSGLEFVSRKLVVVNNKDR